MKRKYLLTLIMVFIFSINILMADENQEYSDWAKSDIEFLKSRNIISEDFQKYYKSDIKRTDFSKLIIDTMMKSLNYDDIDKFAKDKKIDLSKNSNVFIDIEAGDEKGKYIILANKLGIVNGKESNMFYPDDSIKRQEAAKMLTKLYITTLKYMGKEDIVFKISANQFADENLISDWAYKEVYIINSLKIMQGIGDNTFNPLGRYTREQAYVTASRLYRNLIDEKSNLSIKKKGSVQDKSELLEQVDITDEKNIEKNLDLSVKRKNSVQKESEKVEQVDITDKNISKQVAADEFKKKVIELVNIERRKNNVADLIENTELDSYTDLRAHELIQKVEHERPDGSKFHSGLSGYSYVAENIAAGYTTPELVVAGWMDSSGHRKNILNSKYKTISVGYVYDENSMYKHYWVQIFYTKM